MTIFKKILLTGCLLFCWCFSANAAFELKEGEFLFDIPAVEKITWNEKNLITGWAFSKSDNKPINIKIEFDGKILFTKKADFLRQDVQAEFPSYPQAGGLSGFKFVLSMSELPRKNGFLNIILEDSNGNTQIIKGAYLDNNAPVGKIISSSQYIDAAMHDKNIELKIWATDETGIKSVDVKIGGAVVATPKKFFETVLPAPNQGKYTKILGRLYEVIIPKKSVVHGINRLNVEIEDNENKISVIAGPLIVNQDKKIEDKCSKDKIINIYYPVDSAGLKQVEKLQAIKKIFTSNCVKLGLRTRIEYLRSTTGKANDYMFDPDFSQNIMINNVQKTTSGVPLHLALETAKQLNMPLLLTLDGGVWADSAFEATQWDVVDHLEKNKQNVQWNQHDVAEKDDALNNIQSSISSPQLGRMMSLNEYNAEFLHYKKRNLQQAVKYITAWIDGNHKQNINIHFDPDNYVNPWFYQTQWYDYNPLTIKQFREWLTGTGLYSEGDSLREHRHLPSLSITNINDLAGKKWQNIKDIDPPRYTLKQGDGWYDKWIYFKRHLVNQHYVKLYKWSVEAGFNDDNIYTGQGIDKDSAAFVNDKADSWGDQAGVSMQGAFIDGVGAFIMYGEALENAISTRNGANMFDILDGFGRWGLVEFHPASLAYPDLLPSYEQSLEMFNNFAKHNIDFFSPMPGSDAQDQKINPEHFHAFHALAGTKFEDAMVDFVKNYR